MSAQGQDTHFEGTPGGRKTGGAMQAWTGFEAELHEREQAIATMLPRHVNKERFLAAAVAAIKQNPGLLESTPRSLFGAITKAAQDGLLPDGREGVITPYNTKQKNGSYLKQAQWNPMTYGLRKRARELDGMLIDAQVVHQNDSFILHQGDAPRIEHVPAQLGTPRGEMIGAYAVFKREDGTILHREVMDRDQINTVRNQSRDKDSLMWVKFTTEGWRKSVIRRGIKSVPCSEQMERIATRDDENFEFGKPAEALALVPPPAPAATKAIEERRTVEEPALSAAEERALDRASYREMAGETEEP